MNKIIVWILPGVLASASFAQNVGIGNLTPDASARMDIVAADKGVLIPRVSISSIFTGTPVSTPAEGLLVGTPMLRQQAGVATAFIPGTVWTMDHCSLFW